MHANFERRDESKKVRRISIFIFLTLNISTLWAQIDDNRQIAEVVKTATRSNSLSVMPTVVVDSALNATIGAARLSDAVRMMPGVTVRDYGGLGGLKTVSVRSMDAQHTAVALDGIPVGNAQTGAIDLNLFNTLTISSITLHQAQNSSLLQPARLLASGSVLSVNTVDSIATDFSVSAVVTAGSFTTIRPSIRLDIPIDNKQSLSFSASYDHSDGDYPFVLHYGSATDSVSHEHRQNGDIDQLRTEVDYNYNFSSSRGHAKIFGFISERGLPRATTYYNLNSRERLADRQLWLQNSLHRQCRFVTLAVQSRYSLAWQRYTDPDYLSSIGYEQTTYSQHEFYADIAAMAPICASFAVALSLDLTASLLSSENVDGTPQRISPLASLSMKYNCRRIEILASAVAACHADKDGETYSRILPTVAASMRLLDCLAFRVFYKDVVRMPSFNDLYYNQIGNRNLSPERAQQVDFGLAFDENFGILNIDFSADTYYNLVTDKIVAMPTKNVYVWSMMNVGRVKVHGADFSLGACAAINEICKIRLWSSYTYQRALDVTNKNSATYRNQIAYVPRIAGSAAFALDIWRLSGGYSVVFQGKRYSLGENLSRNRIESYAEQTLTLAYNQPFTKVDVSLSAELHNLTDEDYEVVKNFPMPGRAFYLKCSVSI